MTNYLFLIGVLLSLLFIVRDNRTGALRGGKITFEQTVILLLTVIMWQLLYIIVM